jgi:hypothetical protein
MRGLVNLSIFLALSQACSLSAANLELVHGGRPGATIVVANDRDPGLKRAAADLRHYVRAITGVELPTVTDGRRVEGVGLYVGRCEVSLDTDSPPADVTPEAFAIRVRDGNVLFAGRATPAVEFAVYSFIEEKLGVHWFWPGPLGEVLPPRSPGKLVVNIEDEVRVPDWSPRVWSGCDYYPAWKDWNRRNRLSIGGPLPRRQCQNVIHRVFPPEKYAKTHPEYYPLIDGKRWIPAKGDNYWRPCESNPDVQRLVVEYAVEFFKKDPDSDSFSLGMDDISHVCGCPQCCAWDASPNDYARRRFSDRHYRFVNIMARKIADRCPGKHVGTLIYNIARELPKTVDRLEPNVFGYLTQCAPEWFRPGLRDKDMTLTREWAKRCSQLYRYDYWGLGFTMPRYCPHYVADAMKFDKSVGVRGMYVEVYTCWPNTAPMIWMGSKLFWKTGLDTDQLLNEFIAKMFGGAAPVMKRYYDRLEQAWCTPLAGRTSWGHGSLVVEAHSMSVEDVDAGEGLLAEATQAADSDAVRQRIDIVAAGLRWASYPIRTTALAGALARASISDGASAEATLGKIVTIDRLAGERVQVWKDVRARNDLAGETFNALARYSHGRKLNEAEGLAAPAAAAIPRVLQWFADHDPAGSDSAGARLKGLSGPFGGIARAWLLVQQQRPKNLLINGDFEDTGPNAAKAERDGSTTKAPPGWSTWHSGSSPAKFTHAAGKGLRSSRGVGITGADSACFLQTLPVKPGERYLCCEYARLLPPSAEADVTLSVRWRKPDGSWLTPSISEASASLSATPRDFEPLMLIVTVPPGAGQLTFLMYARNLGDEETAWFDNAAVYKLER